MPIFRSNRIIISFTNAAYGVLGAFVKEIINSIAPEDGRIGPNMSS